MCAVARACASRVLAIGARAMAAKSASRYKRGRAVPFGCASQFRTNARPDRPRVLPCLRLAFQCASARLNPSASPLRPRPPPLDSPRRTAEMPMPVMTAAAPASDREGRPPPAPEPEPPPGSRAGGARAARGGGGPCPCRRPLGGPQGQREFGESRQEARGARRPREMPRLVWREVVVRVFSGNYFGAGPPPPRCAGAHC